MSFLAYFESKKNIVFNLRFSLIPRIYQSSVGRQSCHSLYKEAVSVHVVPGDYIVTNFDRFMILFKIALAKLLFDDMT
jgi:hypothetical protein